MNDEHKNDNHRESSALNLDIHITALWLNRILKQQEIIIPITEQYSLINLRMDLGEDKVSVEADIKEKENSSIKLDCVPIWHKAEQQFSVQDIELKTDSNNLLIKSAGWIANTFMGSKLDSKIAQALNQMFAVKKEELIHSGIDIPIPEGKGQAEVKSIHINDLNFKPKGIEVKAVIEGKLAFSLGND